jgi:hypothetical protein
MRFGSGIEEASRQRSSESSMSSSQSPDERYASVHALYEAACARRTRLEERSIETGDFRTEATDTELGGHPKPAINGQLKTGHFE